MLTHALIHSYTHSLTHTHNTHITLTHTHTHTHTHREMITTQLAPSHIPHIPPSVEYMAEEVPVPIITTRNTYTHYM